jgi:serine/threonine-protein kinase SRPK3
MDPFSVYKPINLLFTEENPLNYKPGGYHPVELGDQLGANRYKILSKLGYGGFSTVWLAKDEM